MNLWPFRKKDIEQDLDDEIREHLELEISGNIARGMSPEDARTAAQRRFGNIALVKEDVRSVNRIAFFENLGQDLRYAFRTLRRTPGFTALAGLALGLGIGANTTIFTIFNAVALRPLPVKDAGAIVRLTRHVADRGDDAFSYPEYLDYRDRSSVFSSLIAESYHVSVPADPRSLDPSAKVLCQLVSGNYFSALGAGAALGRTFLPEEDRAPGAAPVVVLSYPFWQRRFHGDSGVVGSTLLLNGSRFTIAGVAAREFIGLADPPVIPDAWAPMMMQSQLDSGRDWLRERNSYRVRLAGRLKPGVSPDRARSELTVLAQHLDEIYPGKYKTTAVLVKPARFFSGTDDIRFQGVVAVMMLAVAMVLAIACANVGNMLLARGAARQKEIAIRLALGAGRRRLIRQLLTESTLLALLGGAVGLVFSMWTCEVLWVLAQQWLQTRAGNITFIMRVEPDVRVLAYALLFSLAAGIFFGLAPALQASRANLTSALKDECPGFGRPPQSASRMKMNLRDLLIMAQVAVCLSLLICAGLLGKGLARAQVTDPGFETQHMLTLIPDFRAAGYDEIRADAATRQLIERLHRLPQVKAAALATRPPMAHSMTEYSVPGRHSSERLPVKTYYNIVSPGFFETLGIPILRGRNFTGAEAEQRAPVAIVSDVTARLFWPGEDPLGKRLKVSCRWCFERLAPEIEVIGVTKSVRSASLTKIDPAYLYFPAWSSSPSSMTVLIRTQTDPGAAMQAIRSTLTEFDKNLPAHAYLSRLEDGPLWMERLLAKVSTAFAFVLAILALALASIGIFGVMAYAVSRRTREIGIRMALGAHKSDVLRLVLAQGMRPAAIGGALGLCFSLILSRLLAAFVAIPDTIDLLFGANPMDPVVFIGVSLFLALVAMIAAIVPARRAMRVDPVTALRYE